MNGSEEREDVPVGAVCDEPGPCGRTVPTRGDERSTSSFTKTRVSSGVDTGLDGHVGVKDRRGRYTRAGVGNGAGVDTDDRGVGPYDWRTRGADVNCSGTSESSRTKCPVVRDLKTLVGWSRFRGPGTVVRGTSPATGRGVGHKRDRKYKLSRCTPVPGLPTRKESGADQKVHCF